MSPFEKLWQTFPSVLSWFCKTKLEKTFVITHYTVFSRSSCVFNLFSSQVCLWSWLHIVKKQLSLTLSLTYREESYKTGRRQEAMFVLFIYGWRPLSDCRHRVTPRKANPPLSPTPCHRTDAVAPVYKLIRRVAATPACMRIDPHLAALSDSHTLCMNTSRRSWVTGTSLAQQCN